MLKDRNGARFCRAAVDPLPAIQDNFPAACKRTLIDEAIRRAIAHAPHDRNRQFAPRTSRIFAISHSFVAYCPIAMAFKA